MKRGLLRCRAVNSNLALRFGNDTVTIMPLRPEGAKRCVRLGKMQFGGGTLRDF